MQPHCSLAGVIIDIVAETQRLQFDIVRIEGKSQSETRRHVSKCISSQSKYVKRVILTSQLESSFLPSNPAHGASTNCRVGERLGTIQGSALTTKDQSGSSQEG